EAPRRGVRRGGTRRAAPPDGLGRVRGLRMVVPVRRAELLLGRRRDGGHGLPRSRCRRDGPRPVVRRAGVGHGGRQGARGLPSARARPALGTEHPPLDAAGRRLGRGRAALPPRRRLRRAGRARPGRLRRGPGPRDLDGDPMADLPLGAVVPVGRPPLLHRGLAPKGEDAV
ncbi:MAG: hypothetical protein AVDCRST_MAG05-1322, partial [uncultured Rubrobacteraceae bacterium]